MDLLESYLKIFGVCDVSEVSLGFNVSSRISIPLMHTRPYSPCLSSQDLETVSIIIRLLFDQDIAKNAETNLLLAG